MSQSFLSHIDVMQAFAATSHAMVVTDATQPDNPIAYANAAFSTLCGYSETEIVGRNCRFLQGPDTDPQVRSELRDAIAQGVGIRREILNYRKDGTTYWNELTIDPMRDAAGRLIGFVSTQSERPNSQTRDALLEAETRLENIANNVPGYIYRRVMRTNGQLDILYCSPSIRAALS